VASWFSRTAVGSFLATLTGNKVLERADVDPVMESLKSQLIGKNVAKDTADSLCEEVAASLVGQRVTAAGSIAGTIHDALRDAIERILTPRRPIDVLAEVRAHKESGELGPYVIVFVGVNGVGKSTSLSKVAYHLKDNHHSVMIAACDSFRAGAVEQLKRHCTALDIPLFQQGYDKDPSVIAAGAIKQAAAKGIDVVLVDTAGRMQNNTRLMTQLARLVASNKPNLVLFVGEALVGNDGVDQLVEFDRALVDHAEDRAAPRRIDGIFLTKFDTIDDKVGAALSMVHRTRIPVVFLGTGQKYTHLRRINVGGVVTALMQ
jgi:signal recognition particle receptor subunit alpha